MNGIIQQEASNKDNKKVRTITDTTVHTGRKRKGS